MVRLLTRTQLIRHLLWVCGLLVASEVLFAWWLSYEAPLPVFFRHYISSPILVGIIFTFWLGHWFVDLFVYGLRDLYMGIPKFPPATGTKAFPPALTGILERLVIFSIAYLAFHANKQIDMAGLLTICAGWIALRLAKRYGGTPRWEGEGLARRFWIE